MIPERTFFSTAAGGIERVTADELRALGAAGVEAARGGVRFRGDLAACYKANLWLRTAIRVLMPIAEFEAFTPEELYAKSREINWQEYLSADHTFAVDCNVRDSAITHSQYASLRLKDAVADQLRERIGRRPSVDTESPDVQINLHISRNVCTIGLDSSGTTLHKRGYRAAQTEAPLNETLAAALVHLSGWDRRSPLLDPLCGSGTILIEAALLAGDVAPGLLRRRFGFQTWPAFDERIWGALLEEARRRAHRAPAARILGSDISPEAIAAAKKNRDAAGMTDWVNLEVRDIANLQGLPGPGVILCNPPYGERLGEAEALKPLYKLMGEIFCGRFKGWTAFVLAGNPRLARHIGLKPASRVQLFNGPIECQFLRFNL
jgi:putative N6-adenine-specific DNA methylase